MDRLPLATIAFAAVVALVLWLTVLVLESVPSEAPPNNTETRAAAEVMPHADDAVACADVENDLGQLVAESRSCSSNADCDLFDYGYPIQCMTAVARDRIVDLRQAFARYHDICEHRVYYDCPTGDSVRRPVCRNRQCAVDLVVPDSLQEETLEHLEIDDSDM